MIVAVPSAQESPPQFLCGPGPNDQYQFCAPQGKNGDFYIAIPQRAPEQNDIQRIQSWFSNTTEAPTPVAEVPAGLNFPARSRVYNVTNFIPSFVHRRNGTRDDVVGPNCYQTALVSAGYARFDGYYVGTDEFRYYLKRDFEPVHCGRAPVGSIVVYEKKGYQIPYDAGDHAAVIILGGFIFQKGGYQNYYPYEVATIDGAMQLVLDHWRPSPDDRWSIPSDPGSGSDYDHVCYQRRMTPLERTTSSTKRDRNWFLPIFRYYRRRLEEIKGKTGSDFKDNLIDIMTIENAWKILGDFGDRVGSLNPMDELLKIDADIVEEYLRFKSLLEEYDEKMMTYVPIKTPWQRIDLYRDYYVRLDEGFKEELNLYLELMNVETTLRPAVIEQFEQRIRSYDPKEFGQPGIKRGIPYFDELKGAIHAAGQQRLGVSEGAAAYELPQDRVVWDLDRHYRYNEGEETQQPVGLHE